MIYALTVVWFEYRRYLPAVMVVAAGTALTAMLVGIVIGLVALVSTPIDHATADIWLTARNAPACDLGGPISRDWLNHLMREPSVTATDELIQSYAPWSQPGRGSVLIVLLGVNVTESSLGPIGLLTAEQRTLLTEIGTVVVDWGDRERLGIGRAGQIGEIVGKRVRVVGFTRRVSSITGPYVFCSLQTARRFLEHVGYDGQRTTYLLARCQRPDDVPGVMRNLQKQTSVSARTADEFSLMSRLFWLTTTKAGLTVFFIAVMGFAVAATVTGQTLYAATLALARELALLRALGAPLTRLARFVLQQAAIVGIAGVLLGLCLIELLTWTADLAGTTPFMDWRLRLGAAGVSMVMVLSAGMVALLSLRRTGPMELLR